MFHRSPKTFAMREGASGLANTRVHPARGRSVARRAGVSPKGRLRVQVISVHFCDPRSLGGSSSPSLGPCAAAAWPWKKHLAENGTPQSVAQGRPLLRGAEPPHPGDHVGGSRPKSRPKVTAHGSELAFVFVLAPASALEVIFRVSGAGVAELGRTQLRFKPGPAPVDNASNLALAAPGLVAAAPRVVNPTPGFAASP